MDRSSGSGDLLTTSTNKKGETPSLSLNALKIEFMPYSAVPMIGLSVFDSSLLTDELRPPDAAYGGV